MNGFHITVAVAPHGKIDVDRELELVKAALLYGDKVTLCSPNATMLSEILDFTRIGANSSPQAQVDLFEAAFGGSLEGFFGSKEEAEQFKDFLRQYKSLLKKRRLSKPELLLRGKIGAGIRKAWNNIREVMEARASDAGMDELVRASKDGLLDLQKLALDHHKPETFPDYLVMQYLNVVGGVLTGAGEYPLFDDPTSDLVKAQIGEGMLSISDATRDRSAQLGLVASLFERLPVLSSASMEEGLEARSELASYLTRFRAAVIAYSDKIANAQWDDDFAADAERVFHGEVEPTILAIEEAIEEKLLVVEEPEGIA